MMRRYLAVLFAAIVMAALPAAAQKPAGQPAPPAISADQARTALDVLNDPAKRAAFAATLNALIKAQPAASHPAPAQNGAAQPAATAAPAGADGEKPAETKGKLPIELNPDSLGAQVLVSASAFVNSLGNEAVEAMNTVQSLPLLYGWAVVMVTNPVARDLLIDVSWRVALTLVCATLVEYGLRRLMRRPITTLEGMAPANKHAEPEDINDPVARAEAGEIEARSRRARPSAWVLLKRVPLVLARLFLELVPVMGIALAGHLLAASSVGGATSGPTVSRLIILAVIDAYALSAALLCVARMLLSPEAHKLRLFHLRDETAVYLMRWIRRLVLIAVIGYAVGEAWLLLGLSDVAHDLLQKAVGLVLHVCIAIIVIQKRGAVRKWLSAPEGATGATTLLRNRMAAVWHWVALFFLVSVWLVWAIELPHGYTVVLHYFLVTAALLIGTRLVLLLLLGGLDRLSRPGAEALKLNPILDARLRIYMPLIMGAVRMVMYLICALGLLQLYGLNTVVWLVSSYPGQRILSSSGTLVTTLIIAFGVWEAVNTGIQNHLEKLKREAQLAKSARLRTLLPLLRSTLLITIAIVTSLMVLSEIGINIAPLLAGAGILGVAIGFGSQKLVQDLITGVFLLLENAMQVGDWVTVSGLSGTVEALSVRTIRLRASDGSVHIIPFSAVTSVTNVNRGLGNASVSVTVPFDEDIDRVSSELKALVTGMRTESPYAAMMLSDLQLWGVDKLDGASVTIAGQIVCTDSGRWPVQREFNRRMKQRFQELGIRIYVPMQTLMLAPPRIPIEQRDSHERAQAAD